MLQQMWVQESCKNIVCVDSYEAGVLKGSFYNPTQGTQRFESLSQFLLKVEELLDKNQMPQASTIPRTFSSLLQPEKTNGYLSVRRGAKATFELNVLFRQHTSWQGVLVWREQKREHSFRSVLELIVLMDSALRSMDTL